ncbi:DUF6003 family protein [Streptomyces cucumeris]|uniref:DUF6003 family protein n=1 Tax=Streptomyces cucumeris TaxID=2962890 RepID=UPI003D7285B0
MADDAYLVLIPDARPRLGAPLAAVGRLECLDTPAVRAWLQAHDTTSDSRHVRILPPEAEASIPGQAERLPLPLTSEETETVRQACATDAIAAVETRLRDFRHTAEDRDRLVHQALATGLPVHRIAELTGLDPQMVGEIAERS